MFNFKNTRKKPSGHPLMIGLFWTVSFFVALLVTLMSLVPIAQSNSYEEGDLKVSVTMGDRLVYAGNNVQIVVALRNVSGELQTVSLNGACQATYAIYDENFNKVFPRYAEEKACNNSGFESFYIADTQGKYYQFVLGGKILPVGKYNIVGYVDGVGASNRLEFEVIEKPNIFAQEKEFCEGVTGRICDPNAGLSCQHVGGFPLGAGMCLPKYNEFTPQDRCKNGVQNCFDDTRNHTNHALIDEYALMGKLSAFGTGEFRPDDPIEVSTFEAAVSEYTGKRIIINTDDRYVQRDTAVEVLYRAYLGKTPSKRSLSCPYTDLEGNDRKAYIFSAYKAGFLADNPENKFYPDKYLSRAHALVLIDRFENFRG